MLPAHDFIELPPEYEFGAIIEVKVTEVAERGVFVEMHPALPPVLIHVSQLSATKVSTVHRTSDSNEKLDFKFVVIDINQ